MASIGQDEYYTYDGLYQIDDLQRGTLNGTNTGISGTPAWEEDFSFGSISSSAYGWETLFSGYEPTCWFAWWRCDRPRYPADI